MTNNESNELATLQTNEKRYNLKNDVIFQAFFSRKGNEEFLADFLKGWKTRFTSKIRRWNNSIYRNAIKK